MKRPWYRCSPTGKVACRAFRSAFGAIDTELAPSRPRGRITAKDYVKYRARINDHDGVSVPYVSVRGQERGQQRHHSGAPPNGVSGGVNYPVGPTKVNRCHLDPTLYDIWARPCFGHAATPFRGAPEWCKGLRGLHKKRAKEKAFAMV